MGYGDYCPPGTGCRSERLRDRLQVWLDNTVFHYRWIANGPLWLLCPVCRDFRRDQPEPMSALFRRALTPTRKR